MESDTLQGRAVIIDPTIHFIISKVHFGEVATTTVFVYNCVSMSSKLNGRKVTRKYMRIAEKIKI